MARAGQPALAFLVSVVAASLVACTAASNSAPPLALAPPATLQAGAPTASSTDQLPPLPSDPAGQRRVLTDYFKSHDLPLVGATVTDEKNGPQVMLYGFVGTPHGKEDAEKKARQALHDPSLQIVNRIIVRPEILTMNTPADGAQDSTADATGTGSAGNGAMLSQIAGRQSYTAPDQTQQTQQQPSAWVSILMAVLMIAPMFIP